MEIVPLRKWIQRAKVSVSKEDYLGCAVTVGFELVKRLRIVMGTNDDNHNTCTPIGATFNPSISSRNKSSDNTAFDFASECLSEEKTTIEALSPSLVSGLKIEDIVTLNVTVSVASNGWNTHNHDHASSCADFVAAEVDIRDSISEPSDGDETPKLLQCDLCFALGQILFELFSQGDPLHMVVELRSTDDTRYQRRSSPLMLEDVDDATLSYCPGLNKSSQSRSITTTRSVSQTKSMSMTASIFLQEHGLPLSICQLIADLLDAERGNLYQSDTALLSLEEAQFDLMQMRLNPQRFLYDEIYPSRALDKTGLFQHVVDGEMYGREAELSTLMETVSRVSQHFQFPPGVCEENYLGSTKGGNANDFPCEAVFLSGLSGSGKSAIIKRLVSGINASDWVVIICTFDRQVMPLSSLVLSFDTFFGKFVLFQGPDGQYLPRDPSAQELFDRISQSLTKSMDAKSFCQICELLPNLGELFHLSKNHGIAQSSINVSSQTAKGLGNHQLSCLFHAIFQAVCNIGLPVFFIAEDLQWSDSFAVDILGDFVRTSACSSTSPAGEGVPNGRLLLVGSFRDDEVNADGFLMNQIKCMEQSKRNIKVNRLVVRELRMHEINKMLSFKFCLPMRHTRELAQLVHHKTCGHPIYITEFLRSIIQRNVISFSVKSRKWVWDDTLVVSQEFSEGVVELMIRKLQQLSNDVIETIKVVSCFGQINISTIQLLDLGQFVPDMQETLKLAVEEGVLEKAGPNYAFSHDVLEKSTYNRMPASERKKLHNKIGRSLVQDLKVAGDAKLCTLVVDQINKCTDILDPVERPLFAGLNLAAGKHSIAMSSYEQARGYFEAGISLLHVQAWYKQYALCLELYEMSVAVSFMDGNVETVSSRLDAIFSNAKSFDDTLNARVLHAKFLASQAKYAEGTGLIIDTLATLGETFPKDALLTHVTSATEVMKLRLRHITMATMQDLPIMQDPNKLNVMKFMGLLVLLGHFTSPMLLPLVCCRMIELTFDSGFCEESISGLLFASHTLLHYSSEHELARKISRISESLMNGNQNAHSLRAKLVPFFSVKTLAEPLQMMADSGYNSAKILGDVDAAMACGLIHCIVRFYSISDLIGLQKYMVILFHQMAKHKRVGALYSVMSYFDSVGTLIGNRNSCSVGRKEGKTNKELYQIAEQIGSTYLMHHVITNQMCVHCYFREYSLVADLSEKNRKMRTGINNTGAKRNLDFSHVFFEGISALCMARSTKQEKWRQIGENSIETMTKLVEYSDWNFENKLNLLQAELHYLYDRHSMAEYCYQASITSAHEHKFLHEKGMAHELYGIYLVENKMVAGGLEQLHQATENYEKWGAQKKADEVNDFIVLVNLTADLWKQKTN